MSENEQNKILRVTGLYDKAMWIAFQPVSGELGAVQPEFNELQLQRNAQ